MAPEDGPSHTGSHNLSSGTLEDHWQDLLKVPTKNNGKSTKRPVTVVQISKRAINSLHDMMMLHRCLIPNDQVSVTDQSSKRGVFGDGAKRGLIAGDGDLEA